MQRKNKAINLVIGIGMALAFLGSCVAAYVISDGTMFDEAYADSTPTLGVSASQYKLSCFDLNYDTLARDTEQYTDARVHVRGEILQVIENDDDFELLVEITENEWGYWDDTIYVTWNGQRFLEDDIVDIYGVVQGRRDYITVLGAGKSVPFIEAHVIELNRSSPDI